MIYVYIISILLIILIIALLGSGMYFYNFAIKRNKKSSMELDPSLQALFDNLQSQINWFKTQDILDVTIQSHDRLKLKGKVLKATEKTNKVIILVHGYTGCHEDMTGFAHLFHEKYKYNVILPNLRGHGESEGHYIGFGWHDRLDMIKWIEYAIELFGSDASIVLFGISMGAATVLLTSGEELPENVKCIISDCAYDGIENIITYQMKRSFKLPKFPLLYVTSLICKFKAKYSFKDGKVFEAVKRSITPILFFHGSHDTFVPTSMVYTLYEAATVRKELIIVEGAKHAEAYDTNPEMYEQALESFLNLHVNKSSIN